MPYYTRVLSPASMPVSPALLEDAARAHGAVVTGDLDQSEWEQLVVTNSEGREVCALERNAVSPGSLAEEELVEFQAEVATCRPASAVGWLQEYLKSVRTIYAFQVLSGTEGKNGWEALGAVKDAVLSAVGGILQADLEGFSNEEGYHILWQFADHVTGHWWMAVLKDGQWERFRMDLGSQAHRAAFMAGEVPEGAERPGGV